MSSSASSFGTVATRYATALLETAEQAKCLDKVEADISDLSAMLSSSDDLNMAIRSPLITREKQKAFILSVAKKAQFDTITSNFLGLLAQNRRLSALKEMLAAFGHVLSVRRGELKARVQTACALTAEQTDMLAKALSKSLDATVILDIEENKELIGGMIVTVGSRMVDDSVRSKLQRLEQAMRSQSNQNIKQEKEVG